MTCITVIVPAFQLSYEVAVTKDTLVRDVKAELEVLTGSPIGTTTSLLSFAIHAFGLKDHTVFAL